MKLQWAVDPVARGRFHAGWARIVGTKAGGRYLQAQGSDDDGDVAREDGSAGDGGDEGVVAASWVAVGELF